MWHILHALGEPNLIVASGIGESRLGMAGDLESSAVPAPDQIEPEAPSRQSADLSDEIDQFGDCADDYYYCYGYEYVAQTESSHDEIDTGPPAGREAW